MGKKWLAVLRIQAGYNQKDLANKIGISGQTLSNIENGKQIPSGTVAYKIAKILDFDMSKFYQDDNEAI